MLAKYLSKLGKLGVLYGGVSAEREVSLESGRAVVAACQSLGVDVVGVDIKDNILSQLMDEKIDSALIVLHGGVGEDGRLQTLLDFMGIRYAGSHSQASMVAMDKVLTKSIWQTRGLPTAEFLELTDSKNLKKILADLGGKAIVKPAHEGSSIGMSIVDNDSALITAYEAARKYDTSVFIEKYLVGEEFTVGILGDEVLPPIKLETDRQFYDYEAKYLDDQTRYICPCGLPENELSQLKKLSLEAFKSLGCQGWGRVDVMKDEHGQFNLLEVNTVPGMTSHSLVPMAAKEAGYSFEALVEKILLGSFKDNDIA